MADDFNNDSLLELYLYETTSLLESLDDTLLKAEAGGGLTAENINEIFRVMHTIKGSSAMMAYSGIAEAAHKTEDLFAVIRGADAAPEFSGEIFDVVLSVSDFLKAEVSKIQAGETLLAEAEALTSVVSSLTERLRQNAPPPHLPDLGRILGASETHESLPPEAPEGGRILGLEPPPEAPEGGRILGLEPPHEKTANTDELAADISKITEQIAPPGGAPDGASTHFLHIYFNEGSKMENIRAFMLVNKLIEKGVVNRTIPASPEHDPNAAALIAAQGFYLSFTTTLFREQIEAVIKGTLSVETVSFVRKLPDDAQGAEAAPKPPKPEPRPQPISAAPPTGQPQTHAPPPVQPKPHDRPVFVDVTKTPPPNPGEAHGRPVFVDVTKPQEQTQKPGVTLPQNISPPSVAAQNTSEKYAADKPAQLLAPQDQSYISVELKKLDALLNLVGEIVINELIVTENPDLDGLELANFHKAARQLDKLTNELQDTVMSIRMLPVSMVFQRMRRIVRDMGKSLEHDTDLILVGETTEIDKTIIDAITDPIMHLVRNAMDHAIEPPNERAAAGKDPVGHIVLSAQNSSGDVIISVSDDGRGLDKTKILDKARACGMLRKPESEYSDKEVYNLLMAPGFSTRDEVSEYSGRGVGLDVVKSNIEKIGGSVIIESKNGIGTNIILKIPLTLAIISCIEISIGKDIYAIPISNIREAFKASAGQLVTEPGGGEMIMLRGGVYPIVRLYEFFGRSGAVTDINDGILLLVEAGDKSACLLADSLAGKFQVVVKPLPTYLNRFNVKRSGISGCTIMGNSNISLIVNVHDFVE